MTEFLMLEGHVFLKAMIVGNNKPKKNSILITISIVFSDVTNTTKKQVTRTLLLTLLAMGVGHNGPRHIDVLITFNPLMLN